MNYRGNYTTYSYVIGGDFQKQVLEHMTDDDNNINNPSNLLDGSTNNTDNKCNKNFANASDNSQNADFIQKLLDSKNFKVSLQPANDTRNEIKPETITLQYNSGDCRRYAIFKLTNFSSLLTPSANNTIGDAYIQDLNDIIFTLENGSSANDQYLVVPEIEPGPNFQNITITKNTCYVNLLPTDYTGDNNPAMNCTSKSGKANNSNTSLKYFFRFYQQVPGSSPFELQIKCQNNMNEMWPTVKSLLIFAPPFMADYIQFMTDYKDNKDVFQKLTNYKI